MTQAFFTFFGIFCLIAVYKTMHYLRHFSNKKLYCWLFFDRNEIMLSSTTVRRMAKERQNTLSMVLLIAFVLAGCLYFLLF